MNWAHKTRPEIEQENCAIVKNYGRRNAIFMVRITLERAIQIQKYIYQYFIDCAKAFNILSKKELLEMSDRSHNSEGGLNNLKRITTENG